MFKTKELIATYYDSFNRMDVEKFLSLLTDDVEHYINQGEVEIGKDSFRKFMAMMDHHYNERVVDLVILVSEELPLTRGAAEFIIEGSYINTQDGLPEAKGQKYRIPVGAFFTIRDGKVARITNFYNLSDWIKQVEV